MVKAKVVKQSRPDFKPNWPWSPITAVAVTIGLYLSQYLAAYALLIYPIVRRWDSAQTHQWLTGSIVANFVFVVLAEGLTVWLLMMFLRHHKVSFRELGWNRSPGWVDVGKALVAFVIYFIVLTSVLSVVTSLIPSINVDQKQQLGFSAAHAPWQLILTYLSLAIFPPLVEETVFRGFLYGSMRKTMTIVQAALATSFLFAVAHLQLGSGAPPLWVAAIDVFILSFALVYLRVRTGSLWSGVFLHCTKNTLAFIALFLLSTHFF